MAPEDRLAAYAALIRKWAPRLDLVSPGDLDRLEERHIEDSLRVVPLMDQLPPGACVDIGSGAGLPGVPLAIARPDRRWTLIEARQRRAAFLEEVVRELDLNARVVAKTAELCAVDPELRESHVLATVRAVTEAGNAAMLADPLLVPGGATVWFKGWDFYKRLPSGAEEWAPGLVIIKKPFELA